MSKVILTRLASMIEAANKAEVKVSEATCDVAAMTVVTLNALGFTSDDKAIRKEASATVTEALDALKSEGVRGQIMAWAKRAVLGAYGADLVANASHRDQFLAVRSRMGARAWRDVRGEFSKGTGNGRGDEAKAKAKATNPAPADASDDIPEATNEVRALQAIAAMTLAGDVEGLNRLAEKILSAIDEAAKVAAPSEEVPLAA
ncbi:hypothetical protein IZ6_25310 [Terrihabitans soli]|uniref:Uncharacterized protein n=1 Tax=Terrihabitans soli TaxID=708113 RepID=A0A6S6QQH4_9HYPH|nr:hypothetical protein [Terrihabitans soli]BCJ91796.1 hypothetical protein IZ6_25310 [Terrihabitans soli]